MGKGLLGEVAGGSLRAKTTCSKQQGEVTSYLTEGASRFGAIWLPVHPPDTYGHSQAYFDSSALLLKTPASRSHPTEETRAPRSRQEASFRFHFPFPCPSRVIRRLWEGTGRAGLCHHPGATPSSALSTDPARAPRSETPRDSGVTGGSVSILPSLGSLPKSQRFSL